MVRPLLRFEAIDKALGNNGRSSMSRKRHYYARFVFADDKPAITELSGVALTLYFLRSLVIDLTAFLISLTSFRISAVKANR
jgi:hypothetical protein